MSKFIPHSCRRWVPGTFTHDDLELPFHFQFWHKFSFIMEVEYEKLNMACDNFWTSWNTGLKFNIPRDLTFEIIHFIDKNDKERFKKLCLVECVRLKGYLQTWIYLQSVQMCLKFTFKHTMKHETMMKQTEPRQDVNMTLVFLLWPPFSTVRSQLQKVKRKRLQRFNHQMQKMSMTS